MVKPKRMQSTVDGALWENGDNEMNRFWGMQILAKVDFVVIRSLPLSLSLLS